MSDHATGYWNGKIYVAGGFNGTGATNAARAYDIASNTWTSIAPLPAALYLPGFGVINGKFYVASGNNGTTEVNTLYIYDTATNTWTTGPVVPTPVTAPGSAVYQGKLYLFGGGAPFPTTITTTQIYDPVANSWSTGPSMNVGRVWFYGGAINNTSIVAPGGDNPPGIEINDNEQLTASWAIKAPLPFVSRGPFAVSDGTFVYIGGGYDGSTVHADLLRYDPVANSYTPLAPSSDGHFLSQAVLVPGVPCGTPTATPTASPSATATATFTPTPTAPATATPTAPATATPTASPTCTPSSFHVLLAYSDIGGPPSTLQSQILAEPGVAAVDLFDASSGTPTLTQLEQYNIVVPFSNNPYSDPVGMGNVLADYADTGGVVVGLNFDWFGPPFDLEGRWQTGGYSPFVDGGPTNFVNSCLGTYDTTHPLMQGISAGSLCAFFRHTLALSSGAVSVAMYQDGQQLCAYKTNNGHTGVGINAYLGENPMNFSGPFGTVIVNAGRWLLSGPCGTPTPTATATTTGSPSATPTCTAGGTPGPWTQAAPVAVDHYGGFMDSDGTVAYEGGGYSFSVGDNTNEFGKFDPVANTWTPLAPVPDLFNAEASGVYAPNVNKLFVFGGDSPNAGTVVNTTRIYDIATNTWSTGTPMPDVRAFMASGYFNGKIYLVGGYNTGNVDPSFGQVWEYDPVANTFNTSRMSMPATLGGPGFGIINGHIYVAGGRDLNNTNLNTLYDYNIAADSWTTGATMPTGVNVPGSAVIGGKLWVFGGGNPFTGPGTMPTSGKTGVRAWLKRLFNPDTTNALQVYDPATNTWSSGPGLIQQRAFPAGTHVGNTAVAVGGYTGSNTTTSVEINVTGGGCPSPTPTSTGSPSATPTCIPGGTPGPWTQAAPVDGRSLRGLHGQRWHGCL